MRFQLEFTIMQSAIKGARRGYRPLAVTNSVLRWLAPAISRLFLGYRFAKDVMNPCLVNDDDGDKRKRHAQHYLGGERAESQIMNCTPI